ncbi:trypsin-like peptidase domain-containing protein [Primorskyibacter sp. S87]|uniref:trypsin-like peptidase domain-containing protein n=1 Tax=Primorskyibacter sp. S87 TaxID=3415126 RepID=UPI003C79BB11
MADQFLSKIRVGASDFVEAGGAPILERYEELQALLRERAGPETAALFAEPLISKGNDASPPTVSWYGEQAGDARPLSSLTGAERDRIEAYLSDHLRPVRALGDDTAHRDLALGALTTYGTDDVMVVGDRPVIVNWGLMPDGNGADATARPAHYAATLGQYLPLQETVSAAAASAHAPTEPPATAVVPPAATLAGTPDPRRVTSPRRLPMIAWLPLVLLLLIAGGVLAWLLMPETRLFHAASPPVVTEEAALAAQRELNDSLRARRAELAAALDGAVCRKDGVLLLPDGLTPEGLTPPAVGTVPPEQAQAAPDAILPNAPGRLMVGEQGNQGDLLSHIEARTVLILAQEPGGLATGSGFVVGPGLIVTNQHVIADAMDGAIHVIGASLDAPKPAQVLKSDGPLSETGSDLALLRIEGADLPAFALHVPSGSLKLHQVIAAGYPGDVLELDVDFSALTNGKVSAVPDLTVTDGIVNTEQQIGPDTRVLMHSAPLSSGNSGGPLVDQCGRVVGVNSFVRKGQLQNRGFALTVADLVAFLQDTPAVPSLDEAECAPTVRRAAAGE